VIPNIRIGPPRRPDRGLLDVVRPSGRPQLGPRAHGFRRQHRLGDPVQALWTEYGTTSSGDSKLRFTGRQKDTNTGLYHLFRRFYDPEVGRFLSQDWILGHLTVPQSLNCYVYAVNNPLRYVDPKGDWWSPLAGGADVVSAVHAAVVGKWRPSSFVDQIDMAMNAALLLAPALSGALRPGREDGAERAGRGPGTRAPPGTALDPG